MGRFIGSLPIKRPIDLLRREISDQCLEAVQDRPPVSTGCMSPQAGKRPRAMDSVQSTLAGCPSDLHNNGTAFEYAVCRPTPECETAGCSGGFSTATRRGAGFAAAGHLSAQSLGCAGAAVRLHGNPLHRNPTRPCRCGIPAGLLTSYGFDAGLSPAIRQFKRTAIVPPAVPGGQSIPAVADLVSAHWQENHILLVILNTKSVVNRLFDALRPLIPADCPGFCLTTWLCQQHRDDVLAQIIQRIENGSHECPA